MRRQRRKTYAWVDRSHQYRFLALVIAYNFAIVIFLGISLFLPDFLQLEDQGMDLETQALAAERILYMHSRVWPALIALICLFGLHSFRFFHRFVGPLFRFRWAFDQIRTGNLNFRVKLRKKDYLRKEETCFNDMMEVLTAKVWKAQRAGREIQKAADELLTHREHLGGELAAQLQNLQEQVHTLVENTDYFKLEPDVRSGTKTPASEEGVDDLAATAQR